VYYGGICGSLELDLLMASAGASEDHVSGLRTEGVLAVLDQAISVEEKAKHKRYSNISDINNEAFIRCSANRSVIIFFFFLYSMR
jgi:hypothetical protein